jgi:hypothetical protein
MDLPTLAWLLETLRVAALVTGCLSAVVGVGLYAVGKRAERRRRRRSDAWDS